MRHANPWEDSAAAAPPTPPLDADAHVDVAIVGAGYLGSSAALALAERSTNVAVLDSHAPGWGASGRNGGQLIPGLKHDPENLIAVFGRERGERLARFAGGTADRVFALIERHGLACEARRTPWMQALATDAELARARSRARQWRERGAAVEFLGRDAAAAIAGTGRYRGAFVDRRAGALQPLSYARELARAAIAAGARVHGGSRVVALRRQAGRWRVATAHGRALTADTVLLCANAYADDLVPALPRSLVAANSLQVATATLSPAQRAAILPGGEVLSDTRRVITYWRVDGAGRLLMGGRGPYREPRDERDWAHLVDAVQRLFPALREIAFTHRWGGRVAIHRDSMPRVHEPAPGLRVAIGCQGRGIGWQTAIGEELSRWTLDRGHEPVLPVTSVDPIPFHALKAVGVAATMALYRGLDRLGIG